MSASILFVFAIIVLATVLFATEWVSFDITAMLVLGALAVSGLLTVEEALQGFGNKATVAIAAMFILSEGLRRTGIIDRAGKLFADLGQRSFWLALGVMMGTIAVISAFINNTAAVAICIPLVVGLSRDLEVSPSKLLMPLSFVSMLGGVCTLIGTSTNLLVSDIAQRQGLRGFEMFEFTPLGLIFLAVGMLYIFTVGIRLIPERASQQELSQRYEVEEFTTDLRVQPGAQLAGKRVDESSLFDDLDAQVLSVRQQNPSRPREHHAGEVVLQEGDVLCLRASPEAIRELLEPDELEPVPAEGWLDGELEYENRSLVEAVAAPESTLERKKIGEVDFPGRFGAIPLAVRRHTKSQHDDLSELKLKAGDMILLSVERDREHQLEQSPLFVLATEIDDQRFQKDRQLHALIILATTVLLAAFGVLPIVLSALLGCLAMIFAGCLSTEEAYQAVNWKVIFLLAGIIPLGTAMENSGAAQLVAQWLQQGILLAGGGIHAAVGGFFLIALLLTNVISNQATAALLAPVAISSASELGLDPRMLLIAITFAASLSFLSPVGYQTNTMIYGPGQYNFLDYARAGLILDLLLAALAILLIPIFWG